MNMRQAVFLIRTADRKGILAETAAFFYRRNLNILECRQYTDVREGTYFMRIAVDLSGDVTRGDLEKNFRLYEERFRVPDLSGVSSVSSGAFSAGPEKDKIAVAVPGARYLVDVLKGGRIVFPATLAGPAFWWTSGGRTAVRSTPPTGRPPRWNRM